MPHKSRRELMQTGITFRELELPSQETDGFVMRVILRHTQPRKIVTVVQQPGQPVVDVETVVFRELPYSLWDDTCSDAGPDQRVSLEDAMAHLETLADQKPLARVALQHITAATQV